MDPKKRRRPSRPEAQSSQSDADRQSQSQVQGPAKPGQSLEETEADREKALADAEWKNLWDATEVIDMDKW
jgi:hypothetical protein